MNEKPKEIFLNSPIEFVSKLIPSQKIALSKLGIKTIEDLIYHFPVRYGDTAQMKNIGSLIAGEEAVVFGKISALKTSKGFRTKVPMADGSLEDETGKIKIVWFNQPYLAKMISEGSFVRVEGKTSQRKKDQSLYFSNPKIEMVSKLPTGVGDSLFGQDHEKHTLFPVYPESRGITSNWFYHALQRVFKSGILEQVVDPIPKEILEKYHLPTLKTALVWIHAPLNSNDALSARKRFAFEEIFFIQLKKLQQRKAYETEIAFSIDKSQDEIEQFTSRFPFKETGAQKRAIATILEDFRKGKAMSRLLEGDVGSGKTAVAATTAYAVVTSRPNINAEARLLTGAVHLSHSAAEHSRSCARDPYHELTRIQDFGNLQVAYMAPTEILAKQHFESFIHYFKHLPINIGLITGSGCKKFPSKSDATKPTDISRTQLLKWVANGEIPILIGTHALIQKSVQFKDLAYVIIDEQHRFGTAQRKKLVHKDELKAPLAHSGIKGSLRPSGISVRSAPLPHLLSMTATPIPRTLALTIYGDLDLTLLDEMPVGRKPIITEIVLPNKRDELYEKVRKELQLGRQAYVICPRIYEPDPEKEQSLNAKSVTEEAKRLKKSIFREYSIDILHSKMKPSEKEKIMLDFSDKKIDILVATSVVEVGVNVPNATVIIIEGGERFGLSQLHQLRGRVIRSNHQAYCFILTESAGQKTKDRLNALQKAKNGFELAEHDLTLRGAGELYGRKQWGLSDIAMEAIKNIKMVEAARTEATIIIEKDSDLKTYPLLQKEVEKGTGDVHFE